MNNAGKDSKIAVVTGASSGFGLRTSIELAKGGFTVIATMRNVHNQGRLKEEAEQAGVWMNMETMKLDVTHHEGVEQVVQQIITKYGRIDVLVNNAGFAVGGMVEELPMELWRQQMETNFFGLVAVTKAVLPSMRKRRSGMIINVSSVSGRSGFPGYGPYAASKFAVEGFSESLRLEMLPFGVHVVLIEPGAYKTEIWRKGMGAILAPPDSPYAGTMKTVMKYSKQMAETASDPIEVARVIARVAQKRYPNLRYMMGKGSSSMKLGKAILPWKWFERIIIRALK
jgi:NAD(P)-dependent dehydrogenase (short-subunit alcohol dehydrogenase family)